MTGLSTTPVAASVPLPVLLANLPFPVELDVVPSARIKQADHALGNVEVTGICSDSRELQSGHLFAALQGGEQHGLDHLDEVNRKAVALLVDADDERAREVETTLPVLRVVSLGQRLGEIAAEFYDQPTANMKVCGVTGTDGKTSVCYFVASVLKELGLSAGYIGTLGWGLLSPGDAAGHSTELADNPLTTPPPVKLQGMLAALKSQGADYAVLEVSSHALEQGRASGVRFDVVALTNLGRDHLDYHGSEQNYRNAKRKLFEWPDVGTAVVNVDDEFGRELLSELASREIKVSTYSREPGQSSELTATDIKTDRQGVSFVLHHAGKQWPVQTSLLGRFNVSNLLAASAALQAFGFSLDELVAMLPRLKPVDGRMERFDQLDRATVVVDFAHTPQALATALDTVREHCNGELWVVFGCGGDRDRGKRPQMGASAMARADRVVVTDDNPRMEASEKIIEDILAGATGDKQNDARPPNLNVIPDRRAAIAHALSAAAADDWVLVAGKGHEDYQIVGRERFRFSDRDVIDELMSGSSPAVASPVGGLSQ